MKHSLASKGLSLSSAQSISNLCNQRSKEITQTLQQVNNTSRSIKIDGETLVETQAHALPENVVKLLQEKSRLHATQAFLMENIKAKDQLINSIKSEELYYESVVPQPKREPLESFVTEQLKDETWGWEQLSVKEYNEFLEEEAYASHIGQFIHKGGKLDDLRKELPNIKSLEFMEIEVGKKTPVVVTTHHTSTQLLTLHEELAALHRKHEQKVNYYKSKVKNSVTKENARIAKENGEKQALVNEKNNSINEAYSKEYNKWLNDYRTAQHEFESKRQGRIEEAINLKIDVPSNFQPVVDEFLKKIE